jgi:hypothetical protein
MAVTLVQNNNNMTLSSYFWRQVSGPEVKLDNKNTSTTFKAPCIDLDFNTPDQKKPYADLTFELVVTDNKVYQAPPLPWTLLLK